MTTETAAILQEHIVEGKMYENQPEERTGELLDPAHNLTRALSN